jgi:hypothetical protein
MKRLLGLGPLTALAAVVAAASWSAATRDVRAPEPAILNANLGSASGASAASVWSVSRAPTTGYRFPNSFTTIGCYATVPAGAPCSFGPQLAGSTLIGVVARRLNTCRCVQ